ncbi:hypothetical protein C8Q77DRAFT_42801 [Trametes polyzona]|nr:hypothetical protein C8Q77DRAFT_42801 [Trametes polyzona]
MFPAGAYTARGGDAQSITGATGDREPRAHAAQRSPSPRALQARPCATLSVALGIYTRTARILGWRGCAHMCRGPYVRAYLAPAHAFAEGHALRLWGAGHPARARTGSHTHSPAPDPSPSVVRASIHGFCPHGHGEPEILLERPIMQASPGRQRPHDPSDRASAPRLRLVLHTSCASPRHGYPSLSLSIGCTHPGSPLAPLAVSAPGRHPLFSHKLRDTALIALTLPAGDQLIHKRVSSDARYRALARASAGTTRARIPHCRRGDGGPAHGLRMPEVRTMRVASFSPLQHSTRLASVDCMHAPAICISLRRP